MSDAELNAITERIIGCGFTVANTLGVGFLEKVYENALAFELRQSGLCVAQQPDVPVRYRGEVVGVYQPDLLVAEQVLIELKATREHHDQFTAQCLNYLKATGLPLCLLMNFGQPRVDVRRYRL